MHLSYGWLASLLKGHCYTDIGYHICRHHNLLIIIRTERDNLELDVSVLYAVM